MSKTIQAIYEEGRLRPLEPLHLQEGDRVCLDLSPVPPGVAKLRALVESCAELTEEQWATFEEASARRRFFRSDDA